MPNTFSYESGDQFEFQRLWNTLLIDLSITPFFLFAGVYWQGVGGCGMVLCLVQAVLFNFLKVPIYFRGFQTIRQAGDFLFATKSFGLHILVKWMCYFAGKRRWMIRKDSKNGFIWLPKGSYIVYWLWTFNVILVHKCDFNITYYGIVIEIGTRRRALL